MMSKNQNTQKIYNALMGSSDIESKFELIIDECKKKHRKFIDPEFYPQKMLTEEDISLFQECQWGRIEDQYPSNLFDNISPKNIHQGSLCDYYFIISLMYISNHVELVKSLFHPKSSLKYGCALIYLFYLGEKIPIIIDTQVAYQNSRSKYPLFSHPRNENDSCWFVLVEKAYAKVCGGYSAIQKGTSEFGVHLLTGFYSAFFDHIVDIIPSKNLDEEKERRSDPNANDKVLQIISKLIKKKAMISTSIDKSQIKNFNETNGLIINQDYSIIDVRESENKHYVKLRNPLQKGQFKGGYFAGSEKWTEQVKKDLDYSNENDGSFWMLFDSYLYYFNKIGYSLLNEKNWKEESVYGKIESYLDGRAPFYESKSVGCIPQWSIKFSGKTIVRLTFEVSGPKSSHEIYLCKNNGNKVNFLDNFSEMMRSSTNSMVNGIEYIVEDFSEPFTFFFTRKEARDDPCYYRILIQSPDTNFTIKKLNDNYIKENWCSFTDTRIFSSSQFDYWDPFDSLPLTTCKQWYIRFPNLLKKKDSELRFRIFKNANEGPLYLLFARTSDKIDYTNYTLDYEQYIINSISNYEEFSIPISFKNFYKFNDVFEYRENDSADYVFTFYRMKDSNINMFKFSVLCKSEFEIGLMPEPDPIQNCGYTIKSKYNEIEENLSSNGKYEFIDQWCLVFKEEPTTLFIEFINNIDQSSEYKIILKEKPKADQMIKINEEDLIQFESSIRENCSHDQVIYKIERTYNPYYLFVQNEKDNKNNDFTLNIFGTKDFEMYRITTNGYGIKAPKFDKSIYDELKNRITDFPEIISIDQPTNFHQIKKEKSKNIISNENANINIIDNDDFSDENSYYYEYSYSYCDNDATNENENVYHQSQNLNNYNEKYQFNQNENFYKNNFVIQENIVNNNENYINNTNSELYTNYDDRDSYNFEYLSEYDEKKNEKKKEEKIPSVSKEKNNEKIVDKNSDINENNKNKNSEITNNDNHSDSQDIPLNDFKNTNTNNDNNELEPNIKPNISNLQFEADKGMLDEAKIYLFKNDIFYFDLFVITQSGKKFILVLIGFGILILKPKFLSKKMTKKQKISFNEFSKISLVANNIEIQFNQKSKKKQILFQSGNSSYLISEIMSHLYATLNQFEINKISFDNISYTEALPKSNSFSIYLRLNSKSSLKKVYIHSEYLTLFAKALFSHSNSFFLAKVKKMKKLFPVLFPCISLNKNIDQIDIVDPKFILPFLLNYTECFDNIRHLKIKGSDLNILQKVICQFKNINSISFHECQIKKIDFISDLISKKEIKSIGFDSALNEQSFQSLIQIDSFESLKCFRVSNINKINFTSCVNNFKHLIVLSLTYCNLDINNVFKALELNQINNLQQLDLSGNISNDQNDLNYSISTKLYTLHVNNVKWEINSLKYFIDVTSSSNLIELSINNIDFIDSNKSKNNWDFLFSNLPNQMNKIHSLSWNSNEINPNFINFLINSKTLFDISFCSCKCSNLNEIQRLLIQSLSIKKLNIHKIYNLNHVLFKEFLTSIQQMKVLEQIDLSHNSFNDDCFETLANSLINSKIKIVSFDDSNIGSFIELLDVYKKLRVNRKTPIDISYPIWDIQRLKLNQNEILILNKNLNKLKNIITMRETCVFDPFEEVFYLKHNNIIKQYWTDETVTEINQNEKVPSQNEGENNINQNTEEINNDNNNNNLVDQNIETKQTNEIVEANNELPNDNNQISENSYVYYTDSEISEIDQTQSQIANNNNITNKSNVDINTSKSISTNSDIKKAADMSSRNNQNEFLDFDQESSVLIDKNPYYHYVNKISNPHNLKENKDLNNETDDLYSLNSNSNYMKQRGTNMFQYNMYKNNINQKSKISFLRLTSSDSDTSDFMNQNFDEFSQDDNLQDHIDSNLYDSFFDKV